MQTIRISQIKGRIDFAIIAVLQEEYQAVLDRFPGRIPVVGGRQNYEFCKIHTGDGRIALVAIVRCPDQGHSVGQLVASTTIEELQPKWLVLVGIAGGVSADDFSLGDVLLANNRIRLLSHEPIVVDGF